MTTADGRLVRHLDLPAAIVVGVGSMIGAGVFVVWSPAAEAAGGGLLLGLLVAAIVATCNATSSAQLAARHPEAGGTYVYGGRRLGSGWGHLAGWGFVVGKTASCAAMALTVGSYTAPEHTRPIAALAVVGITAVNLAGLTRTVAVTRVLLAVSIGALAIVVAAGWAGDGERGRIDLAEGSPAEVLRAAGYLFFAFAGYARIATLGEEVRDPERTIPRAVFAALSVALAIYVVVGVTVLAAVPVEAIVASDAPLRLVVAASGWSGLAPLVRAGATVAALGVLLNLVPGISRTVLAMARDGDLPRALARVSPRRRAPLRAELTVAAVVLIVVLTVELDGAVAFSGVTVLTYYAVTNAAALTLRPAERLVPRPLAVLGLVGCVGLAAALPARALLSGAAVLLIGVLVRRVTSGRGR